MRCGTRWLKIVEASSTNESAREVNRHKIERNGIKKDAGGRVRELQTVATMSATDRQATIMTAT
jgi:hypothetical protein